MKGEDMAQINLGDIARDGITGYHGVVVAVTSWLNGCDRLTLQATGLKDGKPYETYTIDRPQAVLVSRAGHVPDTSTGGPRPEPERATDPR